MTYVDGFVFAVKTADKEKFREYGNRIDILFKKHGAIQVIEAWGEDCLLYTSPSPRDQRGSRMPSSA